MADVDEGLRLRRVWTDHLLGSRCGEDPRTADVGTKLFGAAVSRPRDSRTFGPLDLDDPKLTKLQREAIFRDRLARTVLARRLTVQHGRDGRPDSVVPSRDTPLRSPGSSGRHRRVRDDDPPVRLP